MNAMIWLLKIAAFMMLVGTCTADLLVIIAWLGYGLVEESWTKFPLWIVLVTALVSFLNFIISSFLIGVSKQVATSRGADKKDLPLDEKLSDTIDEGWGTSLVIGKFTLLIVSLCLVATVAVFFNDLKFLIGFHKGMELNAIARPKEAENWFRMSMQSAGADRIAIARFLLAGTLIRERKYAEAEAELQRTLTELDQKNEDHLALLVYLYSAMSNCYMFQNKLPEAELWTKKAIQVIEEHPQMYGLRLRLIGSYKQFLIPEPPPLAVAISGLNDIYILEKKPQSALSTYERILKVLEKQPHLAETDIFDELYRFEHQLSRLPIEQITSQKKSAIAASAELAIQKCKVKDAAHFEQDFALFEAQKQTKN
ncbi:hypothetical protein BH10CYA1_BH10CYA1_31550 [soil metagenome]